MTANRMERKNLEANKMQAKYVTMRMYYTSTESRIQIDEWNPEMRLWLAALRNSTKWLSKAGSKMLISSDTNMDEYGFRNVIDSNQSSICSDYTSYLKTVTHDVLKPFLVNVDVYFLDKSLVFYLVINTMHLDNYKSEQHNQYTLLFSNQYYSNLFNRRNKDIGYSVLKYSVPVTIQYREGDIIEFSLIDHKHHYPYNNIKACIRIPNPHPSPMGVCAYVSDYNSIDELRFWISHYRVQNVSMVIFYVATPMPQLVTEFSGLIRSGYLRLMDFTWPRHVRGMALQLSNQQSQMNACFYHFKYEVQSLILCDTDEFVYSERFPYNLPSLNSYLSQTYPSYDVIHVFIYCIYYVSDDIKLLY